MLTTILAEKIAAAIALGPANTRVRDYADIYTLTGNHIIAHHAARQALLATTRFRGTHMVPLSSVIANLADLRARDYTTYRANIGKAGHDLPAEIQVLVAAVTDFADPLAAIAAPGTTWQPHTRLWTTDSTDQLPN